MRKLILVCTLAISSFPVPAYCVDTQQRQLDKKDWSFHGVTFDNIAGALGILFGIVAVIAYLDQRRVNREQADVMRLIQRFVKKEETEVSVAALTERLRQMEQQTNVDIPKIARRAVLSEQAARLKIDIAEKFLEWKEIESEIESPVDGPLDTALELAIGDRILPNYLRDKREETLRTRVVITGVGILVCGIFFPSPSNYVLQVILGVVFGYFVLEQVFMRMDNTTLIYSRQMMKWSMIGLVFFVVAACIAFTLGFSNSVFLHGSDHPLMITVFAVTLSLFVTLVLLRRRIANQVDLVIDGWRKPKLDRL